MPPAAAAAAASSSWFPRRPSPASKPKRRDRSDDAPPDDFGPPSPHFHQHASTFPSRSRSGIFSAASDALGLRKKIASVSRKKPPAGSPLPGVIEISARNNTTVTASIAGATAHRDCEHEERERLRDAAAQSIGLGPALHGSYKSESRLSLDSLDPPPQPASIPPFPATVAALGPFTTLSATLPKFTPPSSLLVYALAKQWKPRTIVLTSHPPRHTTHVHLFKGPAKDEKEIERLEVTEDSVIFVAEEDVGGRGNVVKLGARLVSAKPTEDNLHSMWFLQITDPAESQRWIAAIKSAVLSQRAVRVGIDISPQMIGKNEPKGDMDVMLSMHLQGIMAARPTNPSPVVPTASPPITTPPSPPASLRSLRISIPSTSTSSPPSSALKGIFSGTRPRSPSVEGSVALPSPSGHTEESFGLAGTSLLTMLRSKSSVDSSSSPAHSLPLPVPHMPGRGSPAPSLRSAMAPVVIGALDLKISRERDTSESSSTAPDASLSMASGSNSHTPLIPSQGTMALSLQPPPRKPKFAGTTLSVTCAPEQKAMYRQPGGNRSVAGNFGIPSRGPGDDTPGDTSPVSPSFSSVRSASFLPSFNINPPPSPDEAHSSEENDRVELSLPGNGTVNSLSLGGCAPTDKLLHTTTISKRWSRQGVTLPKQLTPPSGPPPSVPLSLDNNPRTSMESSKSLPITCTTDRSLSISSSNSRSRAPPSAKSGSSSLSPIFWKRVSASSTYSASSTSTSDSRGRSLVPLSSGGESIHSSSLRSVLAIGVPLSRPLSMSIPGSSSVPHMAKVKRRSMPPPRPAPSFAPPPAPTIQESSQPGPSTVSTSAPQKSFRSSIAQRALRLSLNSPKPPPCSALPPRPDEPVIPRIHRRSSSTGTMDLYSAVTLPSRPNSALAGNLNSNPPASPPSRNLSIRQRLRILSTPSTSRSLAQSSLIPSLQVSSLDLSDDNDDDPPTPYFHSPQPFGLGEHIMAIQKSPSFLQLSNTDSESLPGLPPSGWGTLSVEQGEFLSLSPPPRRGSKPLVTTAARTGNVDAGENGSVPREENASLSQRGSVISLGFVTHG